MDPAAAEGWMERLRWYLLVVLRRTIVKTLIRARHGATMNRTEGEGLDMMRRMNELTDMLVSQLRQGASWSYCRLVGLVERR